jgi:hypothetical protein
MKTKQEWIESRKDLSGFLKINDEVDEEIADYFLCVLPPVYYNNSIIQIGEIYDFDKNGKPVYFTIQKVEEKWFYRGTCRKGEVSHE